MTGKHATLMANISMTVVALYAINIVVMFILGGATIDIAVDDWGERPPFDAIGAVLAAAFAAVSGLPMLLLFKALVTIFEQRELHHGDTLWRLDSQTKALTEALEALRPAEEAAPIAAGDTVVAATAVRTGSILDTLLADPEIAAQARDIRKLYGKGVCASFLTRKAVDQGLEGDPLTEDDIPETM